MSYKPTYVSGDWKATCDSCGCVFKASQLRRRWDGFMVCEQDFEQRHEQDFVRTKLEKISVAWTRPAPTDVFITIDSEDTSSTVNNSAVNELTFN